MIARKIAEESRCSWVKCKKFFSIQNPRKHLSKTALEAAAAFATALAASPFMEKDTEWYMLPTTIAAGLIVLNHLLRGVEIHGKTLSKLPAIIRANLYACLLDVPFRTTLFHEAGHATMMKLLYQNANPQIVIKKGSEGGYTNWGFPDNSSSEFTQLGNMIGNEQKAHALVSAAGAGTELMMVFAFLLAAQPLSEERFEIKAYLRYLAMLSVINVVIYALSAIGNCNPPNPPGHDFCSLESNGGISPGAAVAFIVGSVLFLQLILSSTSWFCKKSKEATNEASQVEEIITQGHSEEESLLIEDDHSRTETKEESLLMENHSTQTKSLLNDENQTSESEEDGDVIEFKNRRRW